MKTKTIFHNVSRTQLEFIITNGVKALADSRNFDSFVLTIETEGGSQSIKIIVYFAKIFRECFFLQIFECNSMKK